jgi:phenylpyruvate tautomerase
MPLLKLETTAPVTDDTRKTLLTALSKIVTETIGKPQDYVMVTVSSSAILMSGKSGESAFVDIRSIGGLTGDVNGKLSQKVCALLNKSLGIPPKRIYINFTDIKAANWGWDGSTFG